MSQTLKLNNKNQKNVKTNFGTTDKAYPGMLVWNNKT